MKPYQWIPRILIVDDDRQVRAWLSRVLEEAGYLVTSVGTARQAHDVVQNRDVELVVTDLGLPDGDGIDLVRRLRVDFPHLKVLVFSGALGGPIAALAERAGANVTLGKPVDTRALMRTVYQLLDYSASARHWCKGTSD